MHYYGLIFFMGCECSTNWAQILIQAAEKSSLARANWGIWFGNLNDITAKLSMTTFAHQSTSYLVYDLPIAPYLSVQNDFDLLS